MPYFTPTQAVTPSSNMYGLHTTRNLKEAYLYACKLINICLDAVRKTFEFDSQKWRYHKDQIPGMNQNLQHTPKYDFIIKELVKDNKSLEHAFAYKHIIRDYLAKKIEEADYYLSCIEPGDLIKLLTINLGTIEDQDIKKSVGEIQKKYERTILLYNIWLLRLDGLCVGTELKSIIDIAANVTGMNENQKKGILSDGSDDSYLSQRKRLLEFFQNYFKVHDRFVQNALNNLEKRISHGNYFNCLIAELLKYIIESEEKVDYSSSSIDYHKLRKNIIDYLNDHLIKSMEDSIIEQSNLRSQSKCSSSICDELLRVDLYSSTSYWLNQYFNSELGDFEFIIAQILELLSYPPKCTNFDDGYDEKTRELTFPSPILESFQPSTPISFTAFIDFAVYYQRMSFRYNKNNDQLSCEPLSRGETNLFDPKELERMKTYTSKAESKKDGYPSESDKLQDMANHYKQLEASINTMRNLTGLDSTPYIVNSNIVELVEHEFKSALEKVLNKPSSYVDINIDINLSINDILSHRDPTKISINDHDPELLEYQIRIELCRLCSSKYIPFSYSNSDKTINGTYYHIGSETFYLTRKQVESLLASLSANPINHEVGKRHSLEQVQTT